MNRQLLLEGNVAEAFFDAVFKQARQWNPLSGEPSSSIALCRRLGQDRRASAALMTTTSRLRLALAAPQIRLLMIF